MTTTTETSGDGHASVETDVSAGAASGQTSSPSQSPVATAAEGGTATANSGAAVIQQYLPKQNNGQWMAFGSMIGTIIGRLYSDSILDKAKDAEKIWRSLTDTVRDRGVSEFTTHADVLLECNDTLWQKLCAFAEGGYCPDYLRILNNAVQAATIQFDAQLRSMRRQATRYNTGLNADAGLRIRLAQATAVVLSYSVASESARQFVWTSTYDMQHSAATAVEAARIGRITVGGELVAAAGQNYANVAQSLRQTAAMDVGDVATFGSMLAVILPILFQFACDPKLGCE